jgi:release factor glutamine methyltransferase
VTLIEEIAALLAGAGIADAAFEAELLVAADAELARARAERRMAGEPLALILQTTKFLGVTLAVRPGVLAPRGETELVGRAAIDRRPALAVDLCCGAGNLACALAVHLPQAEIHAADLTPEACALAEDNARALGVEGRVTVHRGDLFSALPEGLLGKVEVLVCNPPYISSGRLAGDRAALLRFEPRTAFDAGPYGLAIHQRVLQGAPRWLRSGGWIIMEMGVGQKRQIEALAGRVSGYDDVQFLTDANAEPRVIAARAK